MRAPNWICRPGGADIQRAGIRIVHRVNWQLEIGVIQRCLKKQLSAKR
jgi:hypothetical protein